MASARTVIRSILMELLATNCNAARQKLLAKLTYCMYVLIVGHFCGDCLYTTQGTEKMLSKLLKICLGQLVLSRDIYLVESGFKSVAHYLILTRHTETPPINLNDGGVAGTVDLTTAAPQQDLSSEFDSESDDDTEAKKEQYVEIQQADEDEVEVAVAVADDKDQLITGFAEYPFQIPAPEKNVHQSKLHHNVLH